MARGCRGQQVHEKKVDGDKIDSAGRAVEAGRNGRLFDQDVQDLNEGGKLGTKNGGDQYHGGE